MAKDKPPSVKVRTFPDHHAYSRDDIEALRRWARQQPAEVALATTQKDLVKIRLDRLGEHDLWALRIQLQVIHGLNVLEEKLETVVSGGVVSG